METNKNNSGDRFHRTALPVSEARQLILNRVRPIDTVEVDVMDSISRRLAEEVRTLEPIPHFRRSGMDGYAVRSEDIIHASSLAPAELLVIEQIPCGKEPDLEITQGKAARIMTGGMVPDGADAVIMLEVAEEIIRGDQTYVRIRKADTRGANITPIGEEADAGALMLTKGQRIGAGQIALLAALGYPRVSVYRKPKVAIISTGTELLQISEPLQMGKIRNSNAYMLAAQIQSAGGEPLFAGQIPDEYELAEQKLYELLASDADLIMTTGGVSVGDYDIMTDFFMKWEGTTLFNKLAMRPGSPTSAGYWQDKLLFGLSGNPSASFVGFELLVRPVLLRMQEAAEEIAQAHTALLAEDYLKVNGFTRYVRGLQQFRDSKVYVRMTGLDKSSAMASLKDANCLIVIPPTKTGIKAGEQVQVIPLGP